MSDLIDEFRKHYYPDFSDEPFGRFPHNMSFRLFEKHDNHLEDLYIGVDCKKEHLYVFNYKVMPAMQIVNIENLRKVLDKQHD